MAHWFNGIIWEQVHPQATFEMLGYIPTFLDVDNPLLAAQQIDRNYGHGGGWTPFDGFILLDDLNLKYPGDPPNRLLFKAHLRDEKLFFYEHSWFRIEQPDGTW